MFEQQFSDLKWRSATASQNHQSELAYRDTAEETVKDVIIATAYRVLQKQARK